MEPETTSMKSSEKKVMTELASPKNEAPSFALRRDEWSADQPRARSEEAAKELAPGGVRPLDHESNPSLSKSLTTHLLYSSIFERMTDAVVISKACKIVYLNTSFASLIGQSVEELTGQSLSACLSVEYHELLEQINDLQSAQIDMPFSLEVAVCGKNEIKRVELSTSSFFSQSQLVQVWIFREHAKAAGTAEGLMLTNSRQEIIYCSKSTYAFWSLANGKELQGQTWTTLFIPDEQRQQLESTLRHNGNWTGELHGVKAAGDAFIAAVQVQTALTRAHLPICCIWKIQQNMHTVSKPADRRPVTGYAGLIGSNSKMVDLYDNIKLAAMADIPVFLEGETGTGKELVAAAIHQNGLRAGKPFIAINCGALTETIVESELFGHEKGAFTGAHKDRLGKIQAAHHGTLFLDEVCELPLSVQVKLLRVLQENYLERVGSNQVTPVDVRIICATNKNIRLEVKSGRFREDLYYRICVLHLYLPPLRERIEDLDLLISHFLKTSALIAKNGRPTLSQEAKQLLHAYPWPGNIRELKNVIQYAVLKCQGSIIEAKHLPERFLDERPIPLHRIESSGQRKKKLSADAVEEKLRQANGNKQKAACLLGVSRATLYRFLNHPTD